MAEEDLHLRPTTSDEGSELVEPAEARRGVPFMRTLSWTKGLFVLLRSRTEKYCLCGFMCSVSATTVRRRIPDLHVGRYSRMLT